MCYFRPENMPIVIGSHSRGIVVLAAATDVGHTSLPAGFVSSIYLCEWALSLLHSSINMTCDM